MRNDIIEYLHKEVYQRCKQPTNKFGMGCYYHIESVAKNAELLAEKYGADKEVVIIASWLHDIASITDYSMYEEHHVYGSVNLEKLSKEELCVADADAISHFDSVPSLLYLAYVERKMNIEEGVQFVKAKLERSYNKLSDESKFFYKEKYERVMAVLQR